MAENIGGASAPYNTQIPSIVDDADIQTAFRLYHYGSNTGTPSSIPENSIAGHLANIENTKIDIETGVIPTSANLNDFTDTGFYTQEGSPTGSNYPSNFSGMLTVVNSGEFNQETGNQNVDLVFQQYQVVGAPESGGSINTINRTHWRFYIAGSWKPWRTFVETSDFASIGDGRYYTRTEASTLFLSQAAAASTYLTQADANTRLYLQETVKSSSHTLELSDTNKVVAMTNTSDATVTIPFNTSVDFPIGTVINVYRAGEGNVTLIASPGVTLRNSGQLYEQYTEISLRKRAGNEWVASGNIIPV